MSDAGNEVKSIISMSRNTHTYTKSDSAYNLGFIYGEEGRKEKKNK